MTSLFSKEFDDIYFSPEDGLAETKHVFLEGNNLPERWDGRDEFTIVETGFGSGLNFLSAWKLFDETAAAGQVLDYISFEKYPLKAEQILDALSQWSNFFAGRLEQMIDQYPLNIPGFHRVIFKGDNGIVRLTIIIGDINETLPQLVVPRGVDAWFLDGFAPAKNPDMWNETLFDGMKRLSSPLATMSTFTVAGFVRRGVEAAGFAIERRTGFGRKREMLTGVFKDDIRLAPAKRNPKVAIIGGGLAGTACAHILQQNGVASTLFEKEGSLASQASGNLIAMTNPRFSALRDESAEFYSSAFALAIRTFKSMDDGIAFNPCGNLHLVHNEGRKKRLYSALEKWGWDSAHMNMVSAEEASKIAGVKLECEAIHLPDAATVSAASLCRSYVDNSDIVSHVYAQLDKIARDDKGWLIGSTHFDVVILACGAGSLDMEQTSWLPMDTVRGQVTFVGESAESKKLKAGLCYGGYISPARDGMHAVGATFQKWMNSSFIDAADDVDNLENLARDIPYFNQEMKIVGSRAGVRSASHDHSPIVGAVPDYNDWTNGGERDHEGLYISTGHGSYGTLSSIASAHILVDQILGRAHSLPQNVSDHLSPARFLKRKRKRCEI